MPGVFNFDSFGYNENVLGKRPEELSWAELFNGKWRGRVALAGEPLVSLQDAGNAARAAGLVRIRDSAIRHATRSTRSSRCYSR